MKTKVLKKAISVILSLALFVSVFTCLTLVVTTPLTASAITATKMIHVDNNKLGYISYQWRPSELAAIQPNTDYRITFYWENISNASLFTASMFYAKYYVDGTGWQPLFGLDDLSWGNATGQRLQLTDVAHGQLVTFDFTTPADCRDYGSICFFFGDWEWVFSNKSMIFNLAEIKFYTRSGDTLTPLDFADITANETLGTCTNSTPSSTRGKVIRNTTRGDGSEITFVDIESGYFDEISSDTAHFEPARNNMSRFQFFVGYQTYTAGKYLCTMDCKVFAGDPIIRVTSNADSDRITFAVQSDQSNYTATYDPVNYKYTITFDLTADTSNPFGLMIGNYETYSNFIVANPTLYKVDENGSHLSYNYIKPLNSDYYVTKLTSGKWFRRGSWVSAAQTTHYFDREDSADRMAHFVAGDDGYQVLVYKDTGIYLRNGDTYRLMVDVNSRGTNTPSVIFKNGSYDSDSVLGSHTVSGYTWTYDFTLANNSAAGYGIMLGNYGDGNDVDVVFKNLRLYKIENGVIAGANMVAPFNEENYEQRGWSADRSGAHSGKYTPVHCNTSRVNITTVNNDYFPTSAVSTTGTPKMANFYYGYSWRTFIYNDASLPLQKGHTYQFIANVKATSGSPTINLFDSSNNNINGNYTSSYNDSTSGSTRTITFTMAKTLSVVRIRIGNYSDDTDVAASFGNLRLVESGSSTNLIAGLSIDTVQTAAGNRKWQIASAASGYQNATEIIDIPTDYFGTSQKNMYYISEVTTAFQGLEYYGRLAADTTYVLEFDWRTYSGAYPRVYLEGRTGSETWTGLSQTAVNPDNKMDGVYTAITDNELPATVVYKSYGHYAVSFTTPADLYSSGYQNFYIRFANKIIGDSYFNYGRGATYYGNFNLHKSGESGNAILNGDLSIAQTGFAPHETVDDENGARGPVTSAFKSALNGFTLDINKRLRSGSAGSYSYRDVYEDLAIVPQPDNFFTFDGAQPQKTLQFNGGDYDWIRQGLLLESNTQYCLTYNYTFVNAENGAYLQEIDSNNEYSGVTSEYTTYDGTQTKQQVFTTGSDLRTVHENFLMSMYIGRNAPDAIFYFTNVQLRKWNGTEAIGPNLINNGGFFFGDEAKAANGTEITVPAFEVAGDRTDHSTHAIQMLGWDVYGRFNKNTSIEVINTSENFFSGYTSFELRIPMLRRMLIGLQAREYHPYEDIYADESFDVKDYVYTKLAWLEAGGTATHRLAETWKATYVNGDNATDLENMDITLFGNKTRPSTVYYVDNTDDGNGDDNNSGTSPSSPWKTLNKVNTASISSGSAVLFKCGCVWRAKTGECTAGDPNKGVLRCKNGVTYGSYGSGPKPVIVGSYYNYKYRTWTQEGNTNVWKTSINLSGNSHGNDVGIIVYNYSRIGKMTLKKADLANEGDFWCREPSGNDGGDGYVYVYCTQDPSTRWNSIEIGQKRNLCDLANNCTVNNICFKYGGLHGLTASNLRAVCISNCEIVYIGGAYNESRLGNGVEFGLTAADCRVKYCYVHECYDAGLTFQCWGDYTGSFESISFYNNLIENCNYSIEFFTTNNSDLIKDIYIMNNICRGAGYGWSYDEREGYGKDTSSIGCYRTTHIRASSGTDYRYTNLSKFYITGNIFDTAKGALIYWWWNDSDHTNQLDVYDGLTISGNTLYQAARSGDDRIIQFKNESGVYGSSTYGVREALKLFESTDTPTKLNDSKFLLDERVISRPTNY